MHCDPNVGSAAMAAAIKGMFDVSAAKNNESGTDRAVELLHHYFTENSLVGEHLKLVPEISESSRRLCNPFTNAYSSFSPSAKHRTLLSR